jgi:sugar-specific transcriptional regulator TrmB
MRDFVEPLVELGFTALEAEVYVSLQQEPAITGYRIAQKLGKPAPNIYKALESLQAKGAVLVDEAETRLCRAVPPEELLGHLERRFRQNRDRAARTLSELTQSAGDDRVYRLRSRDQVFERCRSMIRSAREVVLIDVFPKLLLELRSPLEEAAATGVQVAVLTYAPAEVEGARVVESARGQEVLARWPGQWISLAVDGNEQLVAFLDVNGRTVHQAIYTGSLYLSWVYHGALSAEMILVSLHRKLEEGATSDELRQGLAELDPLRATEAPGYRELLRRLDTRAELAEEPRD